MVRYSITMNNVNRCSGGCAYCIAASNMDYTLGTSLINEDAIISSCKHIDELNYNNWNYDFTKLAELLDNDPRRLKDKSFTFDIWGADPVTNFQCLRDIVEFLEDYKKDDETFSISASTNGLPLLRKEIVEFIRKHHLSIQLSHDGLGQYVRTKNIDPLDFPIVRELIREGTISAINCTLTAYNYSLFKNIDYFNGKLKEIFPEVWSKTEMASEELSKIYRKLYIKLNHIMDGEYEDNPALEKATGYKKPILTGRDLDNYLEEWDIYFEKYRNHKVNVLELMPYNRYLQNELKRGSNISDERCNICRKYQIGAIKYSEHVDTTGRYCDCNLQDADSPVPNRENKLPDYCKDCRFKLSGECNMCGAVPKRSDKCEFFYRWNQFLRKTRHTNMRK